MARVVPLYNEWYVYHNNNPIIYDFICRYADEAMAAGHERYAIATIWERIRWEITVATHDLHFKMPNNHRAYYARLWLANNPQHTGFFRVAELRSARGFQVDRYGRALAPSPAP